MSRVCRLPHEDLVKWNHFKNEKDNDPKWEAKLGRYQAVVDGSTYPSRTSKAIITLDGRLVYRTEWDNETAAKMEAEAMLRKLDDLMISALNKLTIEECRALGF